MYNARRNYMKYIHCPILLLLSMTVFSCLEPVTDAEILNSHAELVVNSRFYDGEPFQVEVKKILPYNNAAREQYVRDAEVEILAEGKLLEKLSFFDFDEKEDGSLPCYTSKNLVAKYGVNYEVHVEVPGLGIATSSGKVPRPSDVLGTNFEEQGDGAHRGKLTLQLEITDNDPDVRNFFFLRLWQLYQKREIKNDVIEIKKELSDNPLTMDRIQPNDDLEFFIDNRGVMFSDDDFGSDNKRAYTFKVEFDFIPSQDNEEFGDLILELNTIDQPGYSFLVQASRQTSGVGGTVSHSVKDFTNISGGFGIFSGSSVKMDTLQISF